MHLRFATKFLASIFIASSSDTDTAAALVSSTLCSSNHSHHHDLLIPLTLSNFSPTNRALNQRIFEDSMGTEIPPVATTAMAILLIRLS